MNKIADAYLEQLYAEGFERLAPEPIIEDPGNAILDLDARVSGLEAGMERLTEQMLNLAQNNLALIRHVAELEARVTAAPASAIILPDRFN